jgi:phage gpG-like protein
LVIEARVKLGPLQSLFDLVKRPDLRPVWREARKPLREDIKAHRKAQSSEGGKWAPRAASTRERMGRRGARRRMLGKLTTALQTTSDRRHVGMKSRVPWSDVHRTGGRVGRAGSRLPARDFLWVSRGALETISGLVVNYIAGLFSAAIPSARAMFRRGK